jgi:signal transduction histidine kinase
LVWNALARAARELQRSRPDDISDGSEHVVTLCDAIRQATCGQVPNLGSMPSYVPARRLLDALRSEFLDQVASASVGGTASLVAVLRAFESVREALERDSAQQLADRLSGSDALEMIVAVAHDMRSPLTSILFLVDALRSGRSGPITPHQEQQLLLVHGAAFGLSSLASDLMHLVQGGERLLDSSPTPFSLTECLHSVRDIIQPIAEEKKLTIDIVAPTKADRRIGQPAALSQVLLNLATNALKFTERGSVRVAAKEISRARVEFSITDTGRGIPPDVLDTLFHAFRRTRSQKYVFSSAGLGLSICQKLVSAMGGELRVTSEPGSHTCFSFQLELRAAPRL